MKKPLKILLGVLGVSAIIGICFLCIAIYAKKEIEKPKFSFPETVEEEPVSALPTNKNGAFEYVNGLYEKVLSADDVEGSNFTKIKIGDKIVTPLSSADETVFLRILCSSEETLGEMYLKNENVLMNKAKDFPALGFTEKDVTDFTAMRGYVDEDTADRPTVDDGYYYITLTVNPECIDTSALEKSEIIKNIENTLSDMLKVSSFNIEAEGFEAVFKIAYYNDMLVSVELKQNLKINAAVDFINEYAPLSDKTADVSVPYEKVTEIDFMHYGIHFTDRQTVVKKDYIEAVPLEVRVNSETTQDDFTLTFKTSKDGILDIDSDGVMNVTGTSEKPVTVTAELKYAGHTYTDTLIVYATEMEVSEDE